MPLSSPTCAPAALDLLALMFAQGDYRVTWTLWIDNNSADNDNVVTLDVNVGGAATAFTTLTIDRQQFSKPFAPQNFTAYVSLPAGQPLPSLEFRVYYHCCSFIQHEVRPWFAVRKPNRCDLRWFLQMTVVEGPLDGGPFESFWNNQSRFQFVAAHQFPTTPGGESGAFHHGRASLMRCRVHAFVCACALCACA